VTPVGRVLEAEGIDPDLQARVAGRIVLVGSSAQGLFDIRTTPLDPVDRGGHAPCRDHRADRGRARFLSRPDWMPGLELLLVVLTGLTLTLLQLRERPGPGSLAAAMVAGLGAWRLAECSPSGTRASSSTR
jgi:adenylate cyclase